MAAECNTELSACIAVYAVDTYHGCTSDLYA